MDSRNPKAWLEPRIRGDLSHPRWKKYTETGSLLDELYENISGFKLPPSMPSLFGDGGSGTVANAATAIWLCKHAVTLFKEVANTLRTRSRSRRPNLAKLTQDIVDILKVETRYLPNKMQLDLLAQLMVSLGVGLLPNDTDWSWVLNELFNLQFESSSGSRYERPVMHWAISIELKNSKLTLNEREKSFRRLVSTHRSKVEHWDLNRWAYLLLRLELYRPATPMAKEAMNRTKSSDSMDTYGWALFYEGDYDQAEKLLSKAVASYFQGGSDWCEVQYHRLQVAFWSKRISDARMIIEELQRKAQDNYWTKKATELKPLVTHRKIAPAQKGKHPYDVALSFAGEDRVYADQLARLLIEQEVTVFYDDFERAALWGQDLYRYLSEIYQKKTKYCVIFISEHYARKRWTNLECKAAQARAFQENSPYILPIRLDDADIPGILPTMGYMSWQKDGLKLIAETLLQKL